MSASDESRHDQPSAASTTLFDVDAVVRSVLACNSVRCFDAAAWSVMKLSARNAMPGKVVAISKGVTTSHVKIEVASGFVITASITNEAVEELGISVGRLATAIVKSSDVIVGVD